MFKMGQLYWLKKKTSRIITKDSVVHEGSLSVNTPLGFKRTHTNYHAAANTDYSTGLQ